MRRQGERHLVPPDENVGMVIHGLGHFRQRVHEADRGVEVIDRIRAGENAEMNLELLSDLCEAMVDGSLCAMGGMTPFPVQSVMKHFPDDLTPRHALVAGGIAC